MCSSCSLQTQGFKNERELCYQRVLSYDSWLIEHSHTEAQVNSLHLVEVSTNYEVRL